MMMVEVLMITFIAEIDTKKRHSAKKSAQNVHKGLSCLRHWLLGNKYQEIEVQMAKAFTGNNFKEKMI